jgi:hypothetical protein
MNTDDWLTRDTALPAAREQLDLIKKEATRQDVQVFSEQHARIIGEINAHARDILQSPFYSSVGIVFSDAPTVGETWYVSSARIDGTFVNEQVVAWTHWIGGVATRLREASERGEYPQVLKYGAKDREAELAVGPFVRYVIAGTEIQKFEFFDASAVSASTHEQLPAPTEIDEDWAEKEQAKGLSSITETFDIGQDDVIRGPLSGAFLYIGGPGTGKTTLALHRIPYLIYAEQEEKNERPHSWAQNRLDEIQDEPPKFSLEKTLVIVWKDHLVNYLRDCVNKLVPAQATIFVS